MPRACSNAKCTSRFFTPRKDTAKVEDWQRIRIQESEADSADPGRVPRTLEVELTADLVDSCVPGDSVRLCGVVKALNSEVARGRNSARARNLFLL